MESNEYDAGSPRHAVVDRTAGGSPACNPISSPHRRKAKLATQRLHSTE
jgi:hypothetical protein